MNFNRNNNYLHKASVGTFIPMEEFRHGIIEQEKLYTQRSEIHRIKCRCDVNIHDKIDRKDWCEIYTDSDYENPKKRKRYFMVCNLTDNKFKLFLCFEKERKYEYLIIEAKKKKKELWPQIKDILNLFPTIFPFGVMDIVGEYINYTDYAVQQELTTKELERNVKRVKNMSARDVELELNWRNIEEMDLPGLKIKKPCEIHSKENKEKAVNILTEYTKTLNKYSIDGEEYYYE